MSLRVRSAALTLFFRLCGWKNLKKRYGGWTVHIRSSSAEYSTIPSKLTTFHDIIPALFRIIFFSQCPVTGLTTRNRKMKCKHENRAPRLHSFARANFAGCLRPRQFRFQISCCGWDYSHVLESVSEVSHQVLPLKLLDFGWFSVCAPDLPLDTDHNYSTLFCRVQIKRKTESNIPLLSVGYLLRHTHGFDQTMTPHWPPTDPL